MDIKQGEYRLYNHVDGQEVGCITISKVSESYHISLEGNPYEYVNKYSGEHISYDSVRINDAVLSVEEIKDRKALIGEAGGEKIIVMEYTDSKAIFATEIYTDYKIYYMLLVLAPDELEKLLVKASRESSSLNFEVIHSKHALYKACFIWP